MEANCIHNDSFAGIIRWHELDYWRSSTFFLWNSGILVGISRCSCWTPSVCQLPSGPFLKIDPKHKKLEVLDSVWSSSIRFCILTTPQNINSWNSR
jgi:hypothetical protein